MELNKIWLKKLKFDLNLIYYLLTINIYANMNVSYFGTKAIQSQKWIDSHFDTKNYSFDI